MYKLIYTCDVAPLFLDFLDILATPIPLAKSLVITRYVRNTTHLAIAIGWLYTIRPYLAICNNLLGSLGEGPKLASISRRKAARENEELIAVCLG